MPELPINTLVVMVLLLLAIIGAIYFISSTISPTTQTENLGELLACCSTYTANNCQDITIECDGSTIGELSSELGLTDEQLKDRCGCPDR